METKERLAIRANLLEDIEQRRTRTQNFALGSSIEHNIVQRELLELEADILADPGGLKPQFVRLCLEADRLEYAAV